VFPYRDENPRVMTPLVTFALVFVTTAVWMLIQGAGAEPQVTQSVCDLGAVPSRVLGREGVPVQTPAGPIFPCGATGLGIPSLLTSIFLHGGWFHLIGNMWFLWVFGDNVEDSMGHGRFITFYVICGVIAALVQTLATPDSTIPLVGASGAISGVMGAYLVLFPRVKVHTLLVLGFFVTRVALPAYVMLIYWAAIQFLGSVPTLAGAEGGGGVAFLAHLGGFAAGVILIKVFAKPELLALHTRKRYVQGWVS
jgi:membrane associated rhomboid family serine protease